jgi:hypothetical protein
MLVCGHTRRVSPLQPLALGKHWGDHVGQGVCMGIPGGCPASILSGLGSFILLSDFLFRFSLMSIG